MLLIVSLFSHNMQMMKDDDRLSIAEELKPQTMIPFPQVAIFIEERIAIVHARVYLKI